MLRSTRLCRSWLHTGLASLPVSQILRTSSIRHVSYELRPGYRIFPCRTSSSITSMVSSIGVSSSG